MNFVKLRTLDLKKGDSVITAKGTFVVVEEVAEECELDFGNIEVLWLETGRRASIWVEDPVYGPVEVLKKRP